MRKLVFVALVICGCISFAACSSHPVSGSCPAQDFNGNCCIRWSDCNLQSGNPDKETTTITDACHRLDPAREPLLCLPEFNTKDLPDCVTLDIPLEDMDGGTAQQQEYCYGSPDGWNGASTFTYNVFCCK